MAYGFCLGFWRLLYDIMRLVQMGYDTDTDCVTTTDQTIHHQDDTEYMNSMLRGLYAAREAIVF